MVTQLHRYCTSRKIIFGIFILWGKLSLLAQNPFFVWNGFAVDWTYNHRMNRIGSVLTQDSLWQAAATGTGKDSCHVATFYTKVQPEKNIGAYYQQHKLLLFTKEKNRLYFSQSWTIPVNEDLAEGTQVLVLLNGFDLYSNKQADKVQELEIKVNSLGMNYHQKQVTYSLEVNFLANCGTLDCEKFSNNVDYTCIVEVLILVGDDITHENITLKENLAWTTETVSNKPKVQEKKIEGNWNVFGINQLHLILDRDHWMLGCRQWFAPVYTENKISLLRFELNFIQAAPDMKTTAYSRPRIRISKAKPGSGTYQATGFLMNIPNATTSTHQKICDIIWSGKNLHSETEAAKCPSPNEP
ncbi:MAG: hypothetical protein LC115_11175 [Bacteroidia bacterium]|nr:hypothetical protein [Bacteroidia bacterium]